MIHYIVVTLVEPIRAGLELTVNTLKTLEPILILVLAFRSFPICVALDSLSVANAAFW